MPDPKEPADEAGEETESGRDPLFPEWPGEYEKKSQDPPPDTRERMKKHD